jgi:hypothetical protein
MKEQRKEKTGRKNRGNERQTQGKEKVKEQTVDKGLQMQEKLRQKEW